MKKLISTIVLASLFACKTEKMEESTKETVTITGLEKVWETDSLLVTPESVIFDEKRNFLYVSCIGNVPPEAKDGDGYIAKVSPDGKVLVKMWVKGLNGPKGMGIFQDRLFVTDIDKIVEIDLESGKISGEYPLEGSIFLNDISIDENGVVYASDSYANRIAKLENGKIEIWYQNDSLGNPNGLLALGGKLYMITFGSGEFVVFDLKTKDFKKLTSGIAEGDGLIKTGNQWIVSGWGGSVHLINENLEKVEVLNTREEKINAADIWLVEKERLLLVPNFFANKVTAYKLK
ncbi:MAG: gluconolaconase [Cytophagales bacterium]